MLRGPTVFEMCDFHLLILDLNFIKKSLIDKRFFFWETFDFWNLEVFEIFISNFETMELRNLDLKFGTWNFENWAMKFWSWNLRLKFLKTYDLNLKFGNESFELKIWILKDTWKLWKRIFLFFIFFIELTQLLVEF